MLKLTVTACIDASASQVWRVLSALDQIPLWVPAIRRAQCPAAPRGHGAVRICELDRVTITETMVEWDEGRSFRYEAAGAPMMKRASNRWSVKPEGPGRTLVTSEAEVELSGGLAGRLLEPLVRKIASREGERSLAALKHLVEHGEPYAGPRDDLPAAPTAC